jgi:glyoxylase-like metal-dependent hydrolase (beta-lactamase superfamily II)
MKRVLALVGVVLVVLVVGGVAGLRWYRGKFDPPTAVKPNIAQVSVGGVTVVAARVGDKVVLFDAGMDEEGRGVDALLTFMKATRADVSDIFITHGHPDHIAGARLFPKARVHAGAADAGWLAGLERPTLWAPLVVTAVLPEVTVPLTNPLTGASEVQVAEGHTVKCIPAPGHTAGSYLYLYDGVLIAGDVMRLDGDRLAGPPASFDTNSEENKRAVRALRPVLKDAVIEFVTTSHGGTTPAGQGRRMLDAHLASLGA